MKNKPYKEVNTWKRHNVEVSLVYGDADSSVVVTPDNFGDLNNLKKLKMVICFDGDQVYESKQGVFGMKEHSYQVLERKGILFKTVRKTVDILHWVDVTENELFIKWANHFRISSQIQELVKIRLIETYCEDVQSQEVVKPKMLKYIEM